jgi:hypothetical protein
MRTNITMDKMVHLFQSAVAIAKDYHFYNRPPIIPVWNDCQMLIFLVNKLVFVVVEYLSFALYSDRCQQCWTLANLFCHVSKILKVYKHGSAAAGGWMMKLRST